MTATKKYDALAAKKLREFQIHQRVQLFASVAGYSFISVVATLLIMILSGDTFAPILNALGLHGIYYAERGVYADCSKGENDDNAFCSGKSYRANRSWKQIEKGGGTAFSLSE